MGKVVGLSHVTIHILQFEKSMKLYQDILGLELVDAAVFQNPACKEMLSLRLAAGDQQLQLALTAPDKWYEVSEVGNVNHNHFMLNVDDMVSIVERIVSEGYVMEDEDYLNRKVNFFTGPNGEIIGLKQV